MTAYELTNDILWHSSNKLWRIVRTPTGSIVQRNTKKGWHHHTNYETTPTYVIVELTRINKSARTT